MVCKASSDGVKAAFAGAGSARLADALAADFAALTDALVKVLAAALAVAFAAVLATLLSAVFAAGFDVSLAPDLALGLELGLEPGLAATLAALTAEDRAGRELTLAARRAVFVDFLDDRALFTLLALLLVFTAVLLARPGVLEDCRAAFVDCVLMAAI